jgi:hypothetical protein
MTARFASVRHSSCATSASASWWRMAAIGAEAQRTLARHRKALEGPAPITHHQQVGGVAAYRSGHQRTSAATHQRHLPLNVQRKSQECTALIPCNHVAAVMTGQRTGCSTVAVPRCAAVGCEAALEGESSAALLRCTASPWRCMEETSTAPAPAAQRDTRFSLCTTRASATCRRNAAVRALYPPSRLSCVTLSPSAARLPKFETTASVVGGQPIAFATPQRRCNGGISTEYDPGHRPNNILGATVPCATSKPTC